MTAADATLSSNLYNDTMKVNMKQSRNCPKHTDALAPATTHCLQTLNTHAHACTETC